MPLDGGHTMEDALSKHGTESAINAVHHLAQRATGRRSIPELDGALLAQLSRWMSPLSEGLPAEQGVRELGRRR